MSEFETMQTCHPSPLYLLYPSDVSRCVPACAGAPCTPTYHNFAPPMLQSYVFLVSGASVSALHPPLPSNTARAGQVIQLFRTSPDK